MEKRLYAIVDLETTGGFASDNEIIEVAVAIHDGQKVLNRYETLLNPGRKIPPYIIGFTGISDEMVAGAPTFRDIAYELYQLLEGKVFVAHNVNFDYSFLQRSFADAGIDFRSKRVCTVRLSRKILPGFRSYSLGNLCEQLGINLSNAHRAGGDCEATSVLFSKLVAKDHDGHIDQSIKRNSGEVNLPPNLSRNTFDNLPMTPGVYYMHDEKGKVIYVGKAINIKKRIAGHFNGKNDSERKQNFFREIHDISFELCGNELLSLLREAEEIKRLWPKYNRAMKRQDLRFGLYDFEDRSGVLNLGIDRIRRYSKPVISFSNMFEARAYLEELIRLNSLERLYCGMEKMDWVDGEAIPKRRLEKKPEIKEYNRRVTEALEAIRENRESFALFGRGRDPEEQSVILVQEGRYRGYGFVHREFPVQGMADLDPHIREVPEYAESLWLIKSYLNRNVADKILRFN